MSGVREIFVTVESKKYYVCRMCVSVALGIQHEKRMRRILLPSVTCVVVPQLATLSHKRHDFRKKLIEHKMRVFIFCRAFV